MTLTVLAALTAYPAGKHIIDIPVTAGTRGIIFEADFKGGVLPISPILVDVSLSDDGVIFTPAASAIASPNPNTLIGAIGCSLCPNTTKARVSIILVTPASFAFNMVTQ